MANGFLTGTASFVQGSKVMTLDGGVDATYVSSGSHIELDGYMTVEGMSGTVGQITLRENWPHPDAGGVEFVVTYTIEGLVDAVSKVEQIRLDWKQTVTDVNTIISGAAQGVADINGLEGRVETAEGTLDTIDSTLQGYVASASGSASASTTQATKAQEYAVNPYDVPVTGTTDKSSLHHATDSKAAKVLAVQAQSDTTGLKTDVEALKSQTTAIYADAYALATTGEDVEVSPGVYSLIHYTNKAIAAAAAAQAAVSSVTSSMYVVGSWNASSNTSPPPPTIDGGNPVYRISGAGIIDGLDYELNDNIVFDRTTSTHDGTNWTLEKWFKIDNSESIITVNGKKGVVVLAVEDIAGLQATLTAIQNTANAKVAQSSYDAAVAEINSKILLLETDLNIKMWSFIV